MTSLTALALFATMIVLALVPSASVALVVTRAATHGVKNGAAVSAGIVCGDLIFVALAVLGMSAVAQSFAAGFAVLKYLGGAYLIWVGVGLLRSRTHLRSNPSSTKPSTRITSFAAGLLLTLGDLKAILFYASLFPTFIDLAQLNRSDLTLICLITITAVGGVKLAYAFTAHRIVGRLQNECAQKYLRHTAGTAMVGVGSYLIAKG